MITIDNLYKSFGSNDVLKGLSLDIGPGESMVIVGPSGSGKSVTLKCLLGLINSDSGSMIIDGQPIENQSEKTLSDVRAKIGMVFQGSALFDSLTVWENIGFRRLQEKTITPKNARALATEKLKAVGLDPSVAFLFPAELSGGMQRRVALARAIASSPSILFCDEPTAGLDPIMSRIISDLIRANITHLGGAALTITHDMTAARIIADRVAMIWGGQIIWQGPVSELDHSGNPYVEQFIHGKSAGPIVFDVPQSRPRKR